MPFKASRSRFTPEVVRDDYRYETISGLVCDTITGLNIDRVLIRMTFGRSTNLFLISKLFSPFRSKPESRHTPFVAFVDLKSETETGESESEILLHRVACTRRRRKQMFPAGSMSLALSLVAHFSPAGDDES